MKSQKIYIKGFLNFFLVTFVILMLLSFFIEGKINYFQIFLSSLLFSSLFIALFILNKKFKNFFSIKLFVIFLITFILTYLFSSQNFKLLDYIFGIENFGEKFLTRKFFIKNLIFEPLKYERYKSAEESFEEKLKEFNNSLEFLEQKIHEKVNKIRAEHNLKTLKFDEKLREIARYHSKDMALNNYFDHISPKGETLKDRFILFNYSCKIVVNDYVYEGAENIFLGAIYKSYTYEKLTHKILSYDFYDIEEFAEEVVKSWYESEGHRKNMMFEHWKREGIGVYITSDGKVYVTQVFC